jgi:hypothetical protein
LSFWWNFLVFGGRFWFLGDFAEKRDILGNGGFKLARKEFLKFFKKFLFIADLAFPDNKNFPSIFSKFAQIFLISGNITLPFCLPEFGIGCRFYFTIPAFVHMPETAVNKYDFSMFCQDNIGMAGKVFSMKGIAISHSVNN